MDEIILKKLLSNGSELGIQSNLDLLSEAVIDYPYSQPLRILYLSALKRMGAHNFIDELKKAALYIADRKLLYFLFEDTSVSSLGETIVEPQNTVKPKVVVSDEVKEEDKTLDLIDSFLSTLPQEETYSEGLELSSDYTGYLLEESVSQTKAEDNSLDGQDLIDEFLRSQKNKSVGERHQVIRASDECKNNLNPVEIGTLALKEEPEAEDEGFFTETLAKIYVKQQRYDKALEILKKLSLKYPNKNAYFADQIRFLEKLIINDKSK